MPLNPQSSDTEVIELHRYYAKLKKDVTYQKRVSWLGLGGNSEIAVVEYIGAYPGLGPHGNSKHKDEYMRTPDDVMDEMREMSKSKKPKQVYDTLTNKHDELSGPESRQFIDKTTHRHGFRRQFTDTIEDNSSTLFEDNSPIHLFEGNWQA